MTWNSLDLNLLLVFDAIMQAKSLTRAGEQLGMSQPAVSHALARLRHTLKDDLFVRTPEGMRPTSRAERMAGPVRDALHELRATLESDDFEASGSSRTFKIAANNYGARAIVPGLARHVARTAPSVVLDVRPMGATHALDQLDSGEVELVLSMLTDGGDRFKCVGLLDDEFAIIFSKDHPLATEHELSLERFAALPHITITSSGDDTHFVDDALAKRGLARRVFMKVPLHSLILMLIGSEAVSVMPRRIAADLVIICPLAMRPLPFPSPRISLSMMWHRRVDNDPAHRWLRAAVRGTASSA